MTDREQLWVSKFHSVYYSTVSEIYFIYGRSITLGVVTPLHHYTNTALHHYTLYVTRCTFLLSLLLFNKPKPKWTLTSPHTALGQQSIVEDEWWCATPPTNQTNSGWCLIITLHSAIANRKDSNLFSIPIMIMIVSEQIKE